MKSASQYRARPSCGISGLLAGQQIATIVDKLSAARCLRHVNALNAIAGVKFGSFI
jgi:hypothetical protein